MLENFNVVELLAVAALAYAAYIAYAQANDTIAAVAIALPAIYMLGSASGSADTLGTDANGSGIAIGNFNAVEVIAIGAVLYGAYRLYTKGFMTVAIAAAVGAFVGLYESNDAPSTF